MIICQACQAEQMNGTLFCSECGTDLLTPIVPVTPARPESPNGNAGAPHNVGLTAPKLVRAAASSKPKSNPLNPRPPKISTLHNPKAAAAPGGLTAAPFHLLILNTGRLISAPANLETIIIGRSDVVTGDQPDIDLTADNAVDLGVSRRHASITLKEGKPYLKDLGSTNKTFLNRQPLLRDAPYELFDGDEVRMGNIVIKIIYSTPEPK